MIAKLPLLALVGLIAAPQVTRAVPVTWEARGVVEFSDLGSAFLATYMPALAGTQAGDGLVLRISFDTDAAAFEPMPRSGGGTIFPFDATTLVLALDVPGVGTHVFGIDDSLPPDRIAVFDDVVTGEPEQPIVIDGFLFRHDYFAEAGLLDFTILAGFFTTDSSVVLGAGLPSVPDPRLSAGFERQVTIVDPGRDGSIGGSLFGTFTSLVRLPRVLPEPGSLALVLLGLAALAMTRATGRGTTTARCR
jgi:hypothetical protein